MVGPLPALDWAVPTCGSQWEPTRGAAVGCTQFPPSALCSVQSCPVFQPCWVSHLRWAVLTLHLCSVRRLFLASSTFRSKKCTCLLSLNLSWDFGCLREPAGNRADLCWFCSTPSDPVSHLCSFTAGLFPGCESVAFTAWWKKPEWVSVAFGDVWRELTQSQQCLAGNETVPGLAML